MRHPFVKETSLPDKSRLSEWHKSGDFLDCYEVCATATPRQAADIIVGFPGWAQLLLRQRKLVTSPFGLIHDGAGDGDRIGPFPVEWESDTEIIAGFDDAHLNFRISVFSGAGRVALATWVHPHNIAGRLYLATIMPFHIAIAKDALSRVRERRLRGGV